MMSPDCVLALFRLRLLFSSRNVYMRERENSAEKRSGPFPSAEVRVACKSLLLFLGVQSE